MKTVRLQVVSHWRRVVSLPRDSDIAPQVGCLLPCGALRVYAALKDARSCFDTAVRVRGFANLLVVAGDCVDGLELWTVLLVKNVLCDRNVKVQMLTRRLSGSCSLHLCVELNLHWSWTVHGWVEDPFLYNLSDDFELWQSHDKS